MRFLKKGIQTALHDGGRAGYRAMGISPSGPMDLFSHRVLNILLKNPSAHPVLEMHFPAPQILFEEVCSFALYGADFMPLLNGSPILNGKIYSTEPGWVLQFSEKRCGERCYMGLRGDFDPEKWLNSCSPDPALGFPVLAEEINPRNLENLSFKPGIPPRVPAEQIRFVPDFEYEHLNRESRQKMRKARFFITRASNRMGYRLEGPPLQLSAPIELVSSAVGFGTLQLLPDGQVIVLMADAPTSGGYPRLGYVSACDLPALSQMGPGDRFTFTAITPEEAIALWVARENEYKTLELALKIHGH